ncbi:MAG: hypothetical protein FH751_00650 [Firmicutes bacterium]|nr:hypothetical protein [Bacillota bacterium]
MENIEKLKKLYSEGFKCIRYEDGNEGELKAFFKNFEQEKIDDIISYDENEINMIKKFIDTQC